MNSVGITLQGRTVVLRNAILVQMLSENWFWELCWNCM